MSLRILIADDQLPMRRILRQILDLEEFNICGEAESGTEAIAKARDLEPDLVLMDLSMPIVDGFKATEYIHEFLPRTKVIVLTMYNSLAAKQSARRVGADAFVVKDNCAHDLLKTIAALCH